MFYIWWPAYIVPGLMVLAGFAGQLLPGRKYRSPQGPLAPERQKFADSLFLEAAAAVRPGLCGSVVYDYAFCAADGNHWAADSAVYRRNSANYRGGGPDIAGGAQSKSVF